MATALVATVATVVAHPLRAQEESGAESAEAVSVVASGLTGPAGFIVGDDGALFIALAGIGGDEVGTAAAIADAPILGGPTSSVVRVAAGCSTVIADDLPSAVGATGRTFGATDVVVLDEQLYVLVSGGGAAHGQPDSPNGVYRVEPDGGTTLVADLGAWLRANPVPRPRPLEVDPEGAPVAMTVVDGEIWLVEASGGQVLRVGADGTVGRVADLSNQPTIPSAIIPAPGGGAYVAMRSVPFVSRSDSVILLTPQGATSLVWTGLNAPVGLAVDDAGTLYALEAATRVSLSPPFLGPRSGRLVRQAGPDGRTVVVRRLDRPSALAIAPDGALLVALPVAGAVLRVDPALVTGEATAPSGPLVGPTCEGAARSGRPTGPA